MKHNCIKYPQKSLPWNGQQKSLESLNMFNSTYRTLSSYMIKTHKLMFGSQEGKPRKVYEDVVRNGQVNQMYALWDFPSLSIR